MTEVMSYHNFDGPGSLPPGSNGVSSDAMHSPWYNTSSIPYHDSYLNPPGSVPFEHASYLGPTTSAGATSNPPTLSTEGSSWSNYSRAPQPEFVHGYSNLPAPLNLIPFSLQPRPSSSMEDRPKSSPSTFGPGADSMNWPDPRNGLGLSYSSHDSHQSFSTYDPGTYQPVLGNEVFASPSPPEVKQPLPRRQYAPRAPNPSGLPTKRSLDEDEESCDGKRRKRNSSIVSSADLSEDDKLLVQLKEEEGLPWKDIAARFGSHHGKTFQVAALQMRYKRLREKYRVWQGEDVEALKQAYEYWEKYKWDIISSKMLDFGIQERWPSKHCARKWQKLNPAFPGAGTPQSHPTPHLAPAHFSSPGDVSNHYGYIPMGSI